jgi:hypothetical protein
VVTTPTKLKRYRIIILSINIATLRHYLYLLELFIKVQALNNIIPELHTNVSGKVRNTKLPKAKSLWPLFESISNSFHAIEDKNAGKGSIQIKIVRQGNEEILKECDDIQIYPIKDIEIIDNGIGLNNENFKSFLTAESEYKIERGAKGIGRFVCLKAFKTLTFKSQFKSEDDKIYLRQFTFKPIDKGIFDYDIKESNNYVTGTSVILNNFIQEYQETAPRKLEDIGEKIIDHFLVYYLNNKAPNIELIEGLDRIKIDLNNLYNTSFKASIKNLKFTLYSSEFTVHILRLYDKKKGHRIHYCGNDRVVREERLNKLLPDLGTFIEDENQVGFTYQVYVTSKFLDNNVDNERTNFDFPDNSEDSTLQGIANDSPNLQRIRDKVIETLEHALSDYLDNVRQRKFEVYTDHIIDYAPQFKPLLKYKPDIVKKMAPNLAGNRLNIELFKVQSDLEIEVKELGEQVLNESNDIKNTVEYVELYEEFIEKFNDIGKANLAKYIVHRKSVIELLDKFLGTNENDEFFTEDTIHKIFFPLKKESDEITFEQQNLWLIDERLSYHSYLASDKSFKENKVLPEENSLDRPDLLIFNESFAFVNDDAPHNSFVIVEFKRPERKDYHTRDKKKNPVDQVISYISTIRDNKAKDRKGKLIQIDKERTPFYAYIVCDFNDNLLKVLEEKNFTETPDRLGYFYFHDKYKAYIEVISYTKLLKDAKSRNRILFDKLGLPS